MKILPSLTTTTRIRSFFSHLLIAFAATLTLTNSPAFAQTVEEGVSTTEHSRTTSNIGAVGNGLRAQNPDRYSDNGAANAFTTGAATAGYQLTEVSVNLIIRNGNPMELHVAIHEVDSAGFPGAMLAGAMESMDFVTSGAGVKTIPFSPSIRLEPATAYFVVFSAPDALESGVFNQYGILPATTTSQTASPGWSISDRSYVFSTINPAERVNGWAVDITLRLAFGVTATTPALAPTLTNFAADSTDLAVDLSWDVNDGRSDITGYTLTRALGAATPVAITPPPAIGATTLTDTVPAAGDYTYSLIAINGVGPSVAVTVMATATAPVTVTLARNGLSSGNFRVRIEFSERVESAEFVASDVVVVGGNITSFIGLNEDADFYIAIYDIVIAPTLAAAGDITVDIAAGVTTTETGSANQAAVQLVIPYTPPPVPTLSNFAADPTGLAVALSWEVADGGSAITTYTLTRTFGSTAAVTIPITDLTATTFTNTVPAAGVYTYALTATNAGGDSTPAEVTVTVTAGNNDPPTASIAGGGIAVIPGGDVVTLTGSGTDPEGEILTYAWTQTGGSPTVVLNGEDTATLSFAPPQVTEQSTLTFQLITRDSRGLDSTAATTTIVVNPAGSPPVPTATVSADDRTVSMGAMVTLMSTAILPDEDLVINYTWTLIGSSQEDGFAPPGVTVALTSMTIDGAASAATFTAPNFSKLTTLTFQVAVGSEGRIGTDEVEVVVEGMNDMPMANAMMTMATVSEGMQVRFDGTASDDDDIDDDLTYRWVVTYSASAETTTTVTLTGATPTFTPPNYAVETMLTAVLTVTDRADATGTTTVTRTVAGMPNAPTANAGDPQTLPPGATITLDGRASSEPDVDQSLTYEWTIIAPADVTIGGVTIALKSADITPADAADGAVASYAPTAADGSTPIELPGGIMLTFRLTVTDNSGDTEAANMSTDTVVITIQAGSPEQVAAILSEVSRAIVSSTVSAVTNRISNAASGAAGLNVGGLNWSDASTANHIASALSTNTQALTTHSDAMKTLVGNADFQLPLNATDDGGTVAIWGSGEYSDLSGESDSVEWEGNLNGFHLGIDGKIRRNSGNNILIGLALSSLSGELDYSDTTNSNPEKGSYEIDMTTISPYIGWNIGKVDLWASVGVGSGEVERNIEGANPLTSASDAKQTSFAVGGSGAFFADKSSSLRLKGELSAAEFKLDGSVADTFIGETTLDATRARISIEASQTRDLAAGKAYTRSTEIGARFDGGDGITGAGAELGGKLKYFNSLSGFTAEGSARVLFGHNGNYEEWGIQGTLRKQGGRDGQGISFHLTPTYGDIASGIQQLLAKGLRDDNANNPNNDTTTDPDYEMHMTARLGYGFALRNAGGMVTPYTEMVLGASDEYRLGLNWKPSKVFNLTLFGEKTHSVDTENSVRLQGEVNF